METTITNDDRIAMAEVDYVIRHMNERYFNKIPQNVKDFITVMKKSNKQIYVDPKIPLEKQGLKEFTLYFLMILNLKYWCDDARRKDILLMLEENQKKYDNRINNIFDQAETMQGDSNINASTKPKQVVVTGKPKEAVTVSSNVEMAEENQPKANALDDLKAETTAAMLNVPSENILKKFINKIKSIFNRKVSK